MTAHGQDSGHDWETYLDALVAERGSLAAVAEALAATRGHVDDVDSVERALRRLRKRGTLPGGTWGARLLRAFGVPAPVEERLRFMGCYHSRFEDLPVPLCRDLVQLWDRPPTSESAAGRVWLPLARANLALRDRQFEEARPFLRTAYAAAVREVRGRIEAALGLALLATQADATRMPPELAEVEGLLADVDGADAACLRARWAAQVAWVENRRGEFARAEAALRALADGPEVPAFARSRRENGLAYARHKQGDPGAVEHARAAARFAGDAGHVRLRAMALLMIARVAEDDGERMDARERARAIARQLQDEMLAVRAGA
ncbi:MAG: hypothetical protein JNJ59_08355 [Deltaproteobacteria bacterium]|jgi:hypothetical protein|nr:hypothetical protein [Deltaproteobacteria bacterium]